MTEEEFHQKREELLDGTLDDSMMSANFLIEGLREYAMQLHNKPLMSKLLSVSAEKYEAVFEKWNDLVIENSNLRNKLQAVEYENFKMIDQLSSAEVAHDTITHDLKLERDQARNELHDLIIKMHKLENAGK